jgi:hypothetical protein
MVQPSFSAIIQIIKGNTMFLLIEFQPDPTENDRRQNCSQWHFSGVNLPMGIWKPVFLQQNSLSYDDMCCRY